MSATKSMVREQRSQLGSTRSRVILSSPSWWDAEDNTPAEPMVSADGQTFRKGMAEVPPRSGMGFSKRLWHRTSARAPLLTLPWPNVCHVPSEPSAHLLHFEVGNVGGCHV